MLWPRTMKRLWALDPWEEMRHIQREMNRLLSGFSPLTTRRVFPPVNVWTGHDDAVLTAELPGVDPATIDISVVGDTLTLKGARQLDELGEGESFTRQERQAGEFLRKMQLPFRVDPDKVEATYTKGILRVDLPRLEADKPKQVAVTPSQ